MATSTIKRNVDEFTRPVGGHYYVRNVDYEEGIAGGFTNPDDNKPCLQVYKAGIYTTLRFGAFSRTTKISVGESLTIAHLPDNCKMLVVSTVQCAVSGNNNFKVELTVGGMTGDVIITNLGAEIAANTNIRPPTILNISRDANNPDYTGFTEYTQ